ncbi:MAG: type III-B CRISPR module RAMP protein Cmr1 [Caldilineaceae bacterium]
MQKLLFRLQTVTPLFLSGADGQTPELRAASIRGCLRFWLRASLGGQYGENIEQLSHLESQLLGSTDAASPIVLRIRPPLQELQRANTRVLPHSNQKTFRQSAFDVDNGFTLTVSPRLGQPALPALTVPSLLLLCYLGGIGKRSRRGFGSLKLVGIQPEGFALDPPSKIMLGFYPNDGDKLADYLDKLLRWTAMTTGESVKTHGRPYPASQIPAYPLLSEEHAKVLVCRKAFAKNSYLDAMESFWGKLRSDDHRDDRVYGFAGQGARRASPLSVHIHRTEAGHHLVLTAFRSQPSPEGNRGWTKLQQLLEECRRDWNGEYVLGSTTTW